MKLGHKTIIWCAMSALLIFGSQPTFADENSDKKLNAEQRKLQAKIEHNLVAPCCWNMTVDQHESPAARQVRAKITDLILDGKSKDEVLKHFSSQPRYGERILATPSQETWLGKSAYWLIPVALLFGMGVVTLTIKKWSQPEKESQQDAAKSAQKPEEAAEWSKRVEEELEDFDS